MRTRLKLDIEHLQVDSFDTSDVAPGKGTVFGEQCTCYTNCTCPGCPTCDHTACGQNTCGASCNTCDASCHHTDCGCPPPFGTCLDTACGTSPCCA